MLNESARNCNSFNGDKFGLSAMDGFVIEHPRQLNF